MGSVDEDVADHTLLLLDERESVEEALQRLVVTCRDAIPPAADASITLVQSGRKRTVAATSATALVVDEWEYEHDAGPCIDALRDGQEHYVADLAEAAAYPGFGEHLASLGIGSTLGLPLVVDGDVVGALNVYAAEPHTLDEQAYLDLARSVAAQASKALHNLTVYDASRSLAEQLQQAMVSRAVIEQAKGVLMGQTGCSADEAFARLRDASQRENVKLRDVAQRIVDSVAPRK